MSQPMAQHRNTKVTVALERSACARCSSSSSSSNSRWPVFALTRLCSAAPHADGIVAEHPAVHRPDEDRQRDQGDQKSREQNDDRIHVAASLSELPFKMGWNSTD